MCTCMSVCVDSCGNALRDLYGSPICDCGKGISRKLELLYTALIWSAKNFALRPFWRVFVLLQIRAFKHSNYVCYHIRMLFLRYHRERENNEN